MSLSRIALVVLIIGVAVAASYFIITNPLKMGVSSAQQTANPTPDSSLVQGAKLLTKSVLNIFDSSDQNSSLVDVQSNTSLDNVTDYFAQSIAEQIRAKNSAGLTKKDDGSPAILAPTDEDIQKQVASVFSDENNQTALGVYHPKVYEKKLSINQDASRAKQEKYIADITNIIKGISNLPVTDEVALQEITEKKDPSSAKQLASAYGEIGDNLAQITVPTNWLFVHKAILSHFYSAQSIWENIANFENDPLQAIVSTQELKTLAQSAQGIPELIGQEMLKNGLEL